MLLLLCSFASESMAAAAPGAVFAHVVQGNFQSYTAQDWSDDIALAKSVGIDAFALNVGHDSTDADQMKLAFAAAESGQFKLFFSFDMNYFHDAGSSDAILNEYLIPHGGSKAHYTYDDRVFVSTFSGETSATFLDGAASMQDSVKAWKGLFERYKAKAGKGVYFVPDWNDVANVQDAWDGIMMWAAWPDGNGAMKTDLAASYRTASAAKSLTFCAPVSAFFFVHVAAGNNYVWRCDDFLLPTNYENLIKMSQPPDFIELLSWNDYGESHYLGKVRGNAGLPADSKLYVNDDFDHTPMLILTAYYNAWFKTGSPPVIKQEAVVWYYRPHPKAASATSDPLAIPKNSDWVDDNIYAIVLLPQNTKAKSLVITTGGEDANPLIIEAGINLLKQPFKPGATGVKLLDGDGKVLLSGTGAAIIDNPDTYNFNYHAYLLPAGASASDLFGANAGGASTSRSAPLTTSTSSNPGKQTTTTPGSSPNTSILPTTHSVTSASIGGTVTSTPATTTADLAELRKYGLVFAVALASLLCFVVLVRCLCRRSAPSATNRRTSYDRVGETDSSSSSDDNSADEDRPKR